jgi:putative DNA primase/helicase
VLGLSKNILVPNGATFFVNGNGLTIVGDLVRRSIRAGLDPKVDRPELRTFAQPDPVLRVLRDRPVYVAAILTVLRAYHVAGRPKQTEPLGSFEDWSRLARDCLIWLGEPDPCETMERTRKQDPRRRALADILYWWNAVIGRHEVTAKRVIEYAEEREQPQSKTDFNMPPLRYPEFREAQMTVAAGKDGSVDPVRFGKWLGRNAMKFVDGLRIEPGLAVDHSGSGRWRVVPA